MKKKLYGQGSSLPRKEEKGSEQEGKCYKCGYEIHTMDKCSARRSKCNACIKQGHFARVGRTKKIGNINKNETKDCSNLSIDSDSDLEITLVSVGIIDSESTKKDKIRVIAKKNFDVKGTMGAIDKNSINKMNGFKLEA